MKKLNANYPKKLIISITRQLFSQTSRNKNLLRKEVLREMQEKQYKIEQNRVFDGMNSKNTHELAKSKEEHFYPIQHPKNINFNDTNIISYKPPVQNLTEYHRIPSEALTFELPKFESPLDARGLDIAILGPPNAGKSSLINKLTGKNVSAVSSKSNTTEDRVEGIYTNVNDKIQLVYYDTPGAIKHSESYKSKKIVTRAWNVILECDKLLFVVDSVKHLDIVTKEAIKRLLNHKFKPSLLSLMNRLKSIGEENISLDELMKIVKENEAQKKAEEENPQTSSEKLSKNSDLDASPHEPRNLSSILVLNKIDLIENKRKLKTLQEELEDLGAFDKVFHISCETDFGINALKSYLESEALRRPWRYHPDLNSTQTEVEKAEQIIKQILYNRFYKEIPYDMIGYVIGWVPMSNGQLKINFNIEVKYDVQISMVIGKDSKVIRELREEADRQLAMHFQMPVRVNLFVVKRKKLQKEVLNERGIVNI